MTSHARTDIDPSEEAGVEEADIEEHVAPPDITTIATKVDAHEQKLNIHESRWNQLGAAAPIKTEAKVDNTSDNVNLWEIW